MKSNIKREAAFDCLESIVILVVSGLLEGAFHFCVSFVSEYLLLRANTVLEYVNKGQELGDMSSDIKSQFPVYLRFFVSYFIRD